MFYILTEARLFSLNVLNLEVWGLFWIGDEQLWGCMHFENRESFAACRNPFVISLWYEFIVKWLLAVTCDLLCIELLDNV